ncbi:hypothetical protein G9A89_021671 [Geosiphon pyriformis]|nr:hypothetical protein G9A89_021671 [Geosiphon pyriformis]
MPAGTNERKIEEPSEKDNHDKQIAFAGEDVSENDEQNERVEFNVLETVTPEVRDESPIQHRSPSDGEPINEGRLRHQESRNLNAYGNKTTKKGSSRGKVPRKRVFTTVGSEPKSLKKHRTRKGNVFEEYNEAYFDFKFWTGSSEHCTPARMKYDSVLDTFWVCLALRNSITEAKPCDDINKYDPNLVEQARKIPDVWHGCSIGDSMDCDIPSDLTTKVPILYQQLNRKFCLSYSIASALYYCGFKDAARILDSQARLFSLLLFDQQLEKMKDLMPGLVPLIGRPTIYTQRRCRNKKKKTSKKARCLTWDSLFDEIVPHPTLIVPLMPDGKPSHAFCVVDDLIFESSFPFALKLQQESIEWIYGDPNIEIFQVIRFNMKCSPKGHKVEGLYKRPVNVNWDRPSRVFVERDSSNWNLPHYIIEK